MKRYTFVLAASAAMLAATASRADSRFSIGVHVGAPDYRAAPPVVIYAPPPPMTMHTPRPAMPYAPARGYWSDVVVKTWVPERLVVSRDRWGRAVRHCEPGYFTYRTERVWVDGRASCPPAERVYSYGHSHRGR
jgi:hypothetical protein